MQVHWEGESPSKRFFLQLAWYMHLKDISAHVSFTLHPQSPKLHWHSDALWDASATLWGNLVMDSQIPTDYSICNQSGMCVGLLRCLSWHGVINYPRVYYSHPLMHCDTTFLFSVWVWAVAEVWQCPLTTCYLSAYSRAACFGCWISRIFIYVFLVVHKGFP